MNSFDFIEVPTIGVSNNIYVYLKCCNSSDGVCDIEDICKAGWYGLKCDKGKCIKLYKYS
jgi:hypothetical protein